MNGKNFSILRFTFSILDGKMKTSNMSMELNDFENFEIQKFWIS